MRQGSYMEPNVVFPFPRLSVWHAKINKKSEDVARRSGCKASLRHTLGTAAGLALCCKDIRVPLAGAQARFFPNGSVQRMAMPQIDGGGAGWLLVSPFMPSTSISEPKQEWGLLPSQSAVSLSHGDQMGGAVRGANYAQGTPNGSL